MLYRAILLSLIMKCSLWLIGAMWIAPVVTVHHKFSCTPDALLLLVTNEQAPTTPKPNSRAAKASVPLDLTTIHTALIGGQFTSIHEYCAEMAKMFEVHLQLHSDHRS
jgi:hypothetical protein